MIDWVELGDFMVVYFLDKKITTKARAIGPEQVLNRVFAALKQVYTGIEGDKSTILWQILSTLTGNPVFCQAGGVFRPSCEPR